MAVDLALQVSLPHIVGPATIRVSILIGRNHGGLGLLLISGALAVHFVAVAVASQGVALVSKDVLLFKYIETLMRVNALFIRAIAGDGTGANERSRIEFS